MYPAMASSIKVFSAHAEVVPVEENKMILGSRILRARGGSSKPVAVYRDILSYSPRTRR